MHKKIVLKAMLLFLLSILIFRTSFAQRTGYTKDDFVRRRAALADRIKEGMVILFGEAMPQAGAHFRQDNDFFYFSGVEDLNAVLIMNAKTKESHLFLPRQTTREEMMEGPNFLRDPRARESLGLTGIYELSFLDEFIARYMRDFATTWLRLRPADTIDNERSETAIFIARKNRTHYNDQISLDDYRILKLRERYPALEFKDITTHIDALRVIKTPEEIAILRRNGKLSAEAVKQAMQETHPGVFEYELEAAAMQIILKGGARGAAYPPIVGSGPNTCIQHYDKNMRRLGDVDLVLMDFGADLDHLCMDITRTWPASGKFTKEQREVYQIVLEVEKACIEVYRPGVTSEDVAKSVDHYLKKKKINSRGLTGEVGHFVGLSVHDVGPRGLPLQEGMVFAIEPALYYPEKNIGIRIEDTVLITKSGCEVLTRGVPKEIDEIERLIAAVQSKKAAGITASRI
jgi:Xaa-Pro aminopeptidase